MREGLQRGCVRPERAGSEQHLQPGVGAVPYKFKGVPAARTASGETAAVPQALMPPPLR